MLDGQASLLGPDHRAMAHIRGHRAVYDTWAAGEAPGWGWEALLPYFCGSEHAEGRNLVLRRTATGHRGYRVRARPAVAGNHASVRANAFDFPERRRLTTAARQRLS